MTKILSTASSTTAPASTFATAIADAVRAMTSLFASSSDRRHEELSARLQYDRGDLDINPDCVRGPGGEGPLASLDREIMRRGF